MENIHITPKEEIDSRIKNLQERLKKSGIDVAVIVQQADLFYFTGTAQDAHLIVPAKGDSVLMVKRNIERAVIESGLSEIIGIKSFKDIRKNFPFEKKEIGMELDVLPVNMFFKYKSLFSGCSIVDLSRIIREIRMIKSDYEIGVLKDAAKISFLMFSEAKNIIKEGLTEIHIAGTLEALLRENGHQGLIRVRGLNQGIHYGQFMSGKNAAYPSFFDGPTGGIGLNPSYPQSGNFKKIERNEPIFLDYVTVYNGYTVDQARIFSIGSLSSEFMKAHQASIDIKAAFIKMAKSDIDINGKTLYEKAVYIADKAGFIDHFMGDDEKVRFVAHGVGIELNEFPIIAKDFDIQLKPGMVFAMEPKFVFRHKGVVGIEDTMMLTENGLEQITYFDDSIQFL